MSEINKPSIRLMQGMWWCRSESRPEIMVYAMTPWDAYWKWSARMMGENVIGLLCVGPPR